MESQTIHSNSSEKLPNRYTDIGNSLPLVSDALDSLAIGVILLDEQRRLLSINRPAEQMIDVNAEDVLGKPVDLFIEQT